MPPAGLPTPTNCWPQSLQMFADAVAASTTFQALVNRPEQTVQPPASDFVFGRRLTLARSGRTYTAADLAELRTYAMVQSVDYGKHRTASMCYLPHGATAVALNRLVRAEGMVDVGLGAQPSDAQDREWQNVVGSIADEIVTWLGDHGGPWPINSLDLTVDAETAHEARLQQGVWQEVELLFAWGREG